MYVYPNGLKCNASKKTITLYEMVVPTLLLMLAVPGAILGMIYGSRLSENLPLSLFFGAFGSLIIPLLCVLIGMMIFKYWCKPIW